jgi:hypothetical protein
LEFKNPKSKIRNPQSFIWSAKIGNLCENVVKPRY